MSADEKPTDKGVMVYLNANGRLDEAIAAVPPNGGKVVQPKHAIAPFGSRAIVNLVLAAAVLSLMKVFNGNLLAASRLLIGGDRR